MHRNNIAIEESGIVPEHEPFFLGTAERNNCVIMVRPVNKLSTGLIKEGYSTKGLNVKGKSSDWGPQSGFICCDQSYSKLVGSSKVAKFNDQVKKSLKNGGVREVPLIISETRLRDLIARKKILVRINENGVFHISSHDKHHKDFILYPNKKMDLGQYPLLKKKNINILNMMISNMPKLINGYWVLFKDRDGIAKTLNVLAEKNSGIPLTADYDLFSVSPHLSVFAPHGGFLKNKFKTATQRVSMALGQLERRTLDEELGKISNLTQRVKEEINALTGVKVIHHGCEVDNPYTELDFPITVFTPTRQVFGAENQTELEKIYRDMNLLGFATYANRLWTQTGEVTSTEAASEEHILQDYGWNDRLRSSLENAQCEVLANN
ncbi:anthrax toxin-like adenylyl cyclase domain-containing protein [Veronia pacifica]|uniref:Anthrax toxin edema factor central domain-containing protein n=1 Tax=Veronia pacifica TaxID=1080227 RepID=A0A1C3EDR5_9GAMM|nr:anthrax toxin-like adenylyl cyclase domain-containing protein [Veronia pacifica]ODA31375.1 hypothetical protein A8L45_17455 [Veronia pacifica]